MVTGIERYVGLLIGLMGFLPPTVTVKAAARDLRGFRSGKLVAVECVGKAKNTSLVWRCECDCGGTKDVPACYLVKGSTRHCGCGGDHSAKSHPAWNKGMKYRVFGRDREYANRAAWAKAAIAEKGNRCEICGWDVARCDVHHKTPRSAGGKHTLINAMVLCPNCHRIHHERGSVH